VFVNFYFYKNKKTVIGSALIIFECGNEIEKGKSINQWSKNIIKRWWNDSWDKIDIQMIVAWSHFKLNIKFIYVFNSNNIKVLFFQFNKRRDNYFVKWAGIENLEEDEMKEWNPFLD
jgi:hypothetical protein